MTRTRDLVPETLHLTRPAPPLRRAALVALAVLVVSSAVVFVLTVVASWLQNGLDVVPMREIGGGGYDPSGVPYPPPFTVQVLGWLSGMVLPVASGFGGILTALDLIVEGPPRSRADRVLGVAVLVLCAVVFVAYLQVAPLSSWWMD